MLLLNPNPERTPVRVYLVILIGLLAGCGEEAPKSAVFEGGNTIPGDGIVAEPPGTPPPTGSLYGTPPAVTPPATTPPATTPAAGDPPAGDPPAQPSPQPVAGCEATGHGLLWEAKDSIDYHGQPVEAVATHVLGDGCMTSMTLRFTKGGKCPLELVFLGQANVWSLQSGSLTSDPECGPGYGSGKTYQANASASTARLVNVPESVLAPAATSSCAHLSHKLDLKGQLVLSNGGSAITMGVTMLRVSGGIPSQGMAGSCGQAPPAMPQPVEPDPEPEPEPDPTPDPGPAAVDCPAAGTGTSVGSQIASFQAKDSSGAPWSLHDHCGSNGVFLVQTAEW